MVPKALSQSQASWPVIGQSSAEEVKHVDSQMVADFHMEYTSPLGAHVNQELEKFNRQCKWPLLALSYEDLRRFYLDFSVSLQDSVEKPAGDELSFWW